MPKRIIFSNETPNDQGGIIKNNTLDFSRFSKNPVMLYHHGKDPEIGDMPIGHWDNWIFDGANWSAEPIFSEICEQIPKLKAIKTLYEEGNLNASSIGGACFWKSTGKMIRNKDGELEKESWKNENGYKESELFSLYEISLVPLPSNSDAVQMNSIKLYTEIELTQLQSKFLKQNTMPEEKTTVENAAVQTETKAAEKQESVSLGTNQIFNNGLKKIFAGLAVLVGFAGENPTKGFKEEPDGDEPIKVQPNLPKKDLPENVQSEAEKRRAKFEAEEEAKKQEKHESESESEGEAKRKLASKKRMEAEAEDKKLEEEAEKEYLKKLEACNNESEFKKLKRKLEAEYEDELPHVIKKAIERKEAEFESEIESESKLKLKNESGKKTKEEMSAAGYKFAPKPQSMKIEFKKGVTLSSLRNTKEGVELINKVRSYPGGQITPETVSEHCAFLSAVLNDSKYASIIDKLNYCDHTPSRAIPKRNLKNIMASLQSGDFDVINYNNGKVSNYLQLNSTDDLLATPDLYAVQWLSYFLFKLFPTASWKSEIPLFGVQDTAKNAGLIWSNIGINPTIYKGSKPSSPATLETDDTPVTLKMVPFYMQPIAWEPLQLAQLRYDKMATQWAQAMTALNAEIDNTLIHTLLSAIPTASIMFSTGSSFTIGTGGLDNFNLNTAWVGNLLKPALADMLSFTQLFAKQNFPEGTPIVAVLDPTAKKYIMADQDTKSLLTRFVTSEGDELVSYEHTKFRVRSQVGLYDTSLAQIVDPESSFTANKCVGANLIFVPDQVGIGIGNLDVFMLQDPTNYAYKMSADVRMGTNWMRSNVNGGGAYTYGSPSI